MHINEIKLPEVDEFSKRFNECSDSFINAQDESLSKEERDIALDRWFIQKQCLELGIN